MNHQSYKNILICGGCGFMGSNFVRFLHNKYPSYKIFNLDLLTYAGNPENLDDLAGSERYEFIRGDIGDKLLVENLFAKHGFEIVINFAAESHVDRSIVNAFQFIKTNIQGAYILLEAVRQHKIPRFVYISTDEIYGDIPKGIKTSEEYPLNPSNPYAASKASADLIVQSYIRTHKLPAVILRSSNNYGPYQYPEKLNSLVITNVLDGKKIPIHGSGVHVRSWIHVQDFCAALDMVMHRAADGKIYNISGEEKTNLEIINLIAEALDKDPAQYVEFVNDRPGADLRYSPDHSRIAKDLGWERRYHYTETLANLVDWYIKNRGWWIKIKQKSDFLDHYDKQRRGIYDL